MRVMYVGRKAMKTDNVADTGVVWVGHGDIQDVPDDAWPKLENYPDVWVSVPPEPAPDAGLSDAEPVAQKPAESTAAPDLYGMQTAELRELAKARNLAVDLTQRGTALRQAVAAALKA